MPPKKQISKEQIIDNAYEIVRKKGSENLTARLLAKELNCSTQPIYMSFSDMNELKNTLAEKSLSFMMQYIESYSDKNYSPLLSKILGYVQFANEEKYLYQLIFSAHLFNLNQAGKLVTANDELELNMLIYAHGIIMMKSFDTLTIEWTQIQEMIISAYHHFSK
ncbi:MAG TPA: TetR/AcrR family transcriptional regulator [Thermotogota bacterium]|nr:TetR/AcrR family transcriptional regulator [Thermotogota bacterium]HPR97240.1 TetR/AcrR family transcriptional regulator [Thermotogota bacterium]